jgi:hypothetical protein
VDTRKRGEALRAVSGAAEQNRIAKAQQRAGQQAQSPSLPPRIRHCRMHRPAWMSHERESAGLCLCLCLRTEVDGRPQEGTRSAQERKAEGTQTGTPFDVRALCFSFARCVCRRSVLRVSGVAPLRTPRLGCASGRRLRGRMHREPQRATNGATPRFHDRTHNGGGGHPPMRLQHRTVADATASNTGGRRWGRSRMLRNNSTRIPKLCVALEFSCHLF